LALCVDGAEAALHKRPALLVRDEKVTICHATSSEHNPYVQEQVDHEAVVARAPVVVDFRGVTRAVEGAVQL